VIEPHALCRWLEERRVVGIHRVGGDLHLDLEAVRRDEPVRRVTVRLSDVTGERAQYYVGEKILAPHPDPSSPLDLIEVAEYQGGKLSLQGYRKGEPWYVWDIFASEVEIDKPVPGT
jgi:hypothetical protein